MKFEDDLYVVDRIYQSYLKRYWDGTVGNAIHFNHASITAPLPSIHDAALKMEQKRLPVDSKERARIIRSARAKAGRLLKLEEECVAFANNTTDATTLVFWLVDLKRGDSVITTDAENESIPRVFEYFMDHANPGDGWVAWQNFAQHSNSEAGLIKRRRTGVRVKKVKAYGVEDDAFVQNLIEEIDKTTKLVVFCHVLRENGRILPVTQICDAIHHVDPAINILVDGAQCLGTVPNIALEKLSCDFYVATPHKTLCSETVGLLFMSPKRLDRCVNINNVPREKQIIKKDQFSEKLDVKPNSPFAVSLPEIYALDRVIHYYRANQWLKGNDFSAVDDHLMKMKTTLTQQLRELEVQCVSPVTQKFTNFICSFRVGSTDNRELVRQLWNQNIFTSYIHRSNVVRASFSITNSIREVHEFHDALRQLTAEKT